jgi:hypothetical protein
MKTSITTNRNEKNQLVINIELTIDNNDSVEHDGPITITEDTMLDGYKLDDFLGGIIFNSLDQDRIEYIANAIIGKYTSGTSKKTKKAKGSICY